MNHDKILQKLKTPKWNIAIALLAHCLSFYDFAVFGLLSSVIGDLFFPKQDELASLISGFGVFTVAYISRPLGGIVFGYIGDKLGRKKSYIVALMLMVVPTICIGSLPTFSQVGIIAPILLISLRLIQGVALAGTFSGNVLYIIERSPKGHRGLVSGLGQGAIGISYILGSVVTSMSLFFLSKEEFYSWGWRIPFLFGAVTGLIAFLCKYVLQETQPFLELVETGNLSPNPLLEAAKTVKVKALILMGISLVGVAGVYTVLVFYPGYLTKLGGLSFLQIAIITLIIGTIRVIVSPLSGWLFDRSGEKLTLLFLSAAAIAVLAPIVAYHVTHGVFWKSATAIACLGILVGIYQGPLSALQVALFPTRVRSTGLLTAQNLSNSLIGGTTPFIAALLIHQTGSTLAPAFYLSAIAVISLITLCFYKAS